MKLLNRFPCPRCGNDTPLKYKVEHAQARRHWYGCKNDTCRNHFMVVWTDGFEPVVTAQSPIVRPVNKPDQKPLKDAMGCPSCAACGTVTLTLRRKYDTLRRHRCNDHGDYWSAVDADGYFRVGRKRPVSNPFVLEEV